MAPQANALVGSPAASRRRFLHLAALTGAGALLTGCAADRSATPGRPAAAASPPKPEAGQQVTPAEDLMREHGVLKRVLLLYAEGLRRIEARQDLPPEPFVDAARIIRSFIEDYHEKLEENYLFPRFRKARKLVELVDVLAAQHNAGRHLTDLTLRYANARSLADPDQRRQFAESLRQFIRMYNPHEAREDTVLFPAIHTIVGPQEYDDLGEQFEKQEHQLFGQDGFEKMVGRVAGLEKQLGIYDLAQFTPKL